MLHLLNSKSTKTFTADFDELQAGCTNEQYVHLLNVTTDHLAKVDRKRKHAIYPVTHHTGTTEEAFDRQLDRRALFGRRVTHILRVWKVLFYGHHTS